MNGHGRMGLVVAPGQEEGGWINGAFWMLEPAQQGPVRQPSYVPRDRSVPIVPVTDPAAAEWIAARGYPYLGSMPIATSGDYDEPDREAGWLLATLGMLARIERLKGRRYFFAEPFKRSTPREQWPDVSAIAFGEWAE